MCNVNTTTLTPTQTPTTTSSSLLALIVARPYDPVQADLQHDRFREAAAPKGNVPLVRDSDRHKVSQPRRLEQLLCGHLGLVEGVGGKRAAPAKEALLLVI